MSNIEELFKDNPDRLSVMSLSGADSNFTPLKIFVYRNHSFEHIASLVEKFLTASAIKPEFTYSDYDDSLNFENRINEIRSSDILLVWIDIQKYRNHNLKDWLEERLSFVRSACDCKIILHQTGESDLSSLNIGGVIIDDWQPTEKEIGSSIWNTSRDKQFASRYSNAASLHISRRIGLVLIPALVSKKIKAIIVDLDNTLYQGVLGEDGIEGIVPNLRLQRELKKLKDKGFFLSISSKNELSDVKHLFEKRKDFALKWNDFSVHAVNWDMKSRNIRSIIQKLNISSDACLFIDDNPGELAEVKFALPDIDTIEAVNEEYTVNHLRFNPRLFKSRILIEDTIRSTDIKANAERERLRNSLSSDEYFKKLAITLKYEVDVVDKIGRASELMGKTNQFIFSYKRYSEKGVRDLIDNENSVVITISMSDNLSDSGIISVMVCKKNQLNELEIDECVVSCRALGRNIEDIMLLNGIRLAEEKLKTSRKFVNVNYVKGERNLPAFNWIFKLLGRAPCEGINKVKLIDPIGNKYVKIILPA